MGSLLEELKGGGNTPQFVLVLPPGWQEFDPSAETEADLLGIVREKAMHMHRPDIYAQLRTMTARAFADMKASRTLKFYIQTGSWSNDMVLPLSMTATLLTSEPDFTLDQMVVELIRSRGATSLEGDKRFVRWQTQSEAPPEIGGVRQFAVGYLTPIPGTKRQQAIQFTATAVLPPDDPAGWDDPFVSRMFALTDAIVSTVRWPKGEN